MALTGDVKLTYLIKLDTGKAKTAFAEFAWSGTKNRDALKTLERNFDQPQAVVSAFLNKLISYDHDLSSASLLNETIQELPPNAEEAWSTRTIRLNWNELLWLTSMIG